MDMQLVLVTRGVDEGLVIGTGEDAVVVTVVEFRRGKVRLGIQARRDIPVHRQEVHDAIQAMRAKQDAPPTQAG